MGAVDPGSGSRTSGWGGLLEGLGGRLRRARGAGPEPAALRRARLRRRRRLLLLGGVPALALTLVAVWFGTLFGLTLSANRAYAAQDYETALARHQRVAWLNPWLEQWRVHYNVGTALYSTEDLNGARSELQSALETVPMDEEVDPDTGYKPPRSPECRVRHNLYLTYTALARQAEKDGDGQLAQEHARTAQTVAGECEVPPPPPPEEEEEETPPSQDPTPEPSQEPGDQPSSGPSTEPEPSQAPEPNEEPEPSTEPSQEPGEEEPSSEPTGQEPPSEEERTPGPAPSTGPSQEGSASASPDDRDQELRDRNADPFGQTSPPGSKKGQDSEGGKKPW